jgi:PhnB protein
MHVITYIHFLDGQAEEALNFYKAVTGGEIIMVSRVGDGPLDVPAHLKNRIMHARLQIGETVLYLSDTFDENKTVKGNNIALSLHVGSPAEVDELFGKLSQDGKAILPPNDAFWGARFSMLQDKFGVNWMVSCELEPTAK